MRDLPEEYWHDSYKRRANRRVKDGTPTERRGGAPAGIRRLKGDEPCKAITSGARTEFIHPSENRNLTLRECARAQSFPDEFQFKGTVAERALLIGNAVAPLMAETLARTLIEDLRCLSNSAELESGELLSFVPTLSSGMSPALRNTTDILSRVFSLHSQDRQKMLWQ